MVLRRTLRMPLRILLGPLLVRLDHRVHHLLDPVWTAVQRLEHRADALEGSTTRLFDRAGGGGAGDVAPLLLDAVATQHAALRGAARRDQDVWSAIERDDHRIGYLEQHLEVVRKEVLFELRYGRADGTNQVKAAVEPKILDEAKVAAMAGDLRLNVGSGTLVVAGYLNVDARALDGVDVVADVGDLPFDDGSVAEVRSAHVLEHFPEEELRRRVLPHWVAKLRPGGTVRAVVPDAVSMMQAWSGGAMSFGDLREVTFGGQDYEGDFHFTMFSVESLSALLHQAGLVEVEVVETGRRNGLCFEMELVARTPG